MIQEHTLKVKGFSLIEMMVVLAIAMILAGIATPSMTSTIQNGRLSSLYNELMSGLHLARSIAVTRGSSATLCSSNADGSQCDTSNTNWSNGWIVFADSDGDGTVDSGENILFTKTDMPRDVKIASTNNQITYSSQGYAEGWATHFSICDKRGDALRKGLLLSSLGRVREAESGDALESCP